MPLALEKIPETSFICEKNGTPICFISVILMNVSYAMAENLLSNPTRTGKEIKEAAEALWAYIQNFVKALQYRGIFCLAPNTILMRRYKQVGLKPVMGGLTSMFKEIH